LKNEFVWCINSFTWRNDNIGCCIIEVNCTNGKIKKSVIKSKAGFNEKVIIVGLTEITKGDEGKAKDITKIISQKREMKEKTFLKKLTKK
jgi:hypothetical protein